MYTNIKTLFQFIFHSYKKPDDVTIIINYIIVLLYKKNSNVS